MTNRLYTKGKEEREREARIECKGEPLSLRNKTAASELHHCSDRLTSEQDDKWSASRSVKTLKQFVDDDPLGPRCTEAFHPQTQLSHTGQLCF